MLIQKKYRNLRKVINTAWQIRRKDHCLCLSADKPVGLSLNFAKGKVEVK